MACSFAADFSADGDQKRIDAEGTYSKPLLAISGPASLRFTATVPREGTYVVRVAGNSGPAIRSLTLQVDGKPAELENYAGLDMNDQITRELFSPAPRVVSGMEHHTIGRPA